MQTWLRMIFSQSQTWTDKETRVWTFPVAFSAKKTRKKDELRRATDDGRKRVQNAMNERERLGDRGSIMITDQLKKLSAEDWETKTLMWHRNCYTNFASVSRLERLRNKATKDRNKLSPYPKRRKPGWKRCWGLSFCKTVNSNWLGKMHILQGGHRGTSS